MKNQEKIQYFGVWINRSDRNKLTRDNYAIIDKHSSIWTPGTPLRYADSEKRKKYFEDEECKIYNDAYCQIHQEKCLINFDKNMEFFKQISKDEFENSLQKLISSNQNIKQVFDLNDCKQMCGIYIIVLDEYKQVYIGQSEDIKRRIMHHWSKQKQFDRLIFGSVNDSVLSIDSFGAFDTTRIYVLKTKSVDSFEKIAVSKFPPHLKLNRIGGGKISDILDVLQALTEMNHRPLKDCHNEEYAERYEKEMDVTYFVPKEYCDIQDLLIGDDICVETLRVGTDITFKTYGKVEKIYKNKLVLSQYYGATIDDHCFSLKLCNSAQRKTDVWFSKTKRFSKIELLEKKEVCVFWRSKKFPQIEA